MRLTPCVVAGSNLSRARQFKCLLSPRAITQLLAEKCPAFSLGRRVTAIARPSAPEAKAPLRGPSASFRTVAHPGSSPIQIGCSAREGGAVGPTGGSCPGPVVKRVHAPGAKTATWFEAIARTSCVVLTWPGGPGPSSGSAASANSLRPLLPPASMRF